MDKINTKRCLICKQGKKKNDCLHWHIDPDTKEIWVWCVGKCQRGYGIREYAAKAGLSLSEFLKQDFDFRESVPNEVQKMTWPNTFIPLFDSRAEEGVSYLKEMRGIQPDDNVFYDLNKNGIVFPYFFDNVFCGAQIRYINPIHNEDGSLHKITTMPGTRLGLLFYNWNQQVFSSNIKGIIVTEGAFNALSIQQAINSIYPDTLLNPWKCISCSGSGLSKHHIDVLSSLKNDGVKVVLAPDSDKAGLKMLKKAITAECITHYNMTMDTDVDWNDLFKSTDKKDFIKFFMGNMKIVK